MTYAKVTNAKASAALLALCVTLACPAMAQVKFDPSDPRLKYKPEPPKITFEEERAIYSTRPDDPDAPRPHTIMIDRHYVDDLQHMPRKDRAKTLEKWDETPGYRVDRLLRDPATVETPLEKKPTPVQPAMREAKVAQPKIAPQPIAPELKRGEMVSKERVRGERISDGQHDNELLVGDDKLRDSYRKHEGYREPGLEPERYVERRLPGDPLYDPTRDPLYRDPVTGQLRDTGLVREDEGREYNRDRILNREPKVTRLQDTAPTPADKRALAPHTPTMIEREQRRDIARRNLEASQQRSRLSAFDTVAPDSKAPVMRNERGRLSTFDPTLEKEGVWGTNSLQGTEQWEERKRLNVAPPRIDAFSNTTLTPQKTRNRIEAFDRPVMDGRDLSVTERKMLNDSAFRPEERRVNAFSHEVEDKTGLPTYQDPHPVTVRPFDKPNEKRGDQRIYDRSRDRR